MSSTPKLLTAEELAAAKEVVTDCCWDTDLVNEGYGKSHLSASAVFAHIDAQAAELAARSEYQAVLETFGQEWDYNDAGELIVTFDTSAAEYIDERTPEDADTTDVQNVFDLMANAIRTPNKDTTE